MGKYMDDALARRAREASAHVASWQGEPAVPFAWSGARWETPAGQWRDLPLIRRGMGEWLANLAGWLRYENYEAMTLAERKAKLEWDARNYELNARTTFTDPGANTYALRQAAALRGQAAETDVPPMTVELVEIEAFPCLGEESKALRKFAPVPAGDPGSGSPCVSWVCRRFLGETVMGGGRSRQPIGARGRWMIPGVRTGPTPPGRRALRAGPPRCLRRAREA
ncbi:hypothetical protein [Kitasatospora sp. NPDC004272]